MTIKFITRGNNLTWWEGMCCICYGTFRWYGGFSKQILTYGCLQSDLSLDELHFFFSNIIYVCWKNRSARRKPRRYRDNEQTMTSLIGKLPQKPWKISHRNPTQITTLHIPNQHYRRKHSSRMSSSTKRQVLWSSSSSSSPSPLAQCLLKIKGHLKLQPYFRMHNNSDNSGECHLPHVVESTDIVLLLSALLTEDSDVLFSPDSKLNTHKKRLECYSCKCHHI